MLKAPSIHPLVRQGVAAGMAEHMDVDREGQPCRFASSLDEPGDPLALEWVTALIDEDIGRLARQATKARQLVPLKVVRAVPRSLQPAD